MKIITIQEYVKAIEKLKILLYEVDDNTPSDSYKMIELMNAAEIIEAYEDIHFKLPEPTILDKILFYFEQRFKFGISNVAKEIGEEPTLFSELDLQDLRKLPNDFDYTKWIWNDKKDDENLNRIAELIKQVENESFEFTYSAEELRRGNQRNAYIDHNEELMLEREFFRINAKKFLPMLAKSCPNGVKNLIDVIKKEKELFCCYHMAYKNFIGTVQYSEEDNVYFGRLLNIRDLVLYEADKKVQLRVSFYEAVEYHIGTD